MALDFSDLGLDFTSPQTLVGESSMTLYGPPGSWKTTIAASAVEEPELCPVLYLDLENSTASVHAKYPKEEYPDLKVLQLRDWTTAQQVMRRVAEQPHQFKTVVVDPINALSHYLQLHMIRRVEEKKELARIPDDKRTPEQRLRWENLRGVNVAENTNNSLGQATNTKADYGIIGNLLTEIIYGLSVGPFFAIFITHATDKVPEGGTKAQIQPDMAGKVASDRLRQRPHIVAYTELGKDKNDVEHCAMHFRGALGKANGVPFDAKERLGGLLGPHMIDPTMPKLWAKMHGKDV